MLNNVLPPHTIGTASAAAPLRGPRNIPLPAKQISIADVTTMAMPQRRLLSYGYYGYSPTPYGYSPKPYGA